MVDTVNLSDISFWDISEWFKTHRNIIVVFEYLKVKRSHVMYDR